MATLTSDISGYAKLETIGPTSDGMTVLIAFAAGNQSLTLALTRREAGRIMRELGDALGRPMEPAAVTESTEG